MSPLGYTTELGPPLFTQITNRFGCKKFRQEAPKHGSIRTCGAYFVFETYVRILTYVISPYVSYVKRYAVIFLFAVI